MTSFRQARLRTDVACLLPLLLCAILGLGLRFTGIRHGAPDLVLHPDVAKQAHVAAAVYRGRLDIRGMFRDDFKLTAYPYGGPVIIGLGYRGLAALDRGAPAQHPSTWRWSLRLARFAAVSFALAAMAVMWLQRRRWGPWRTAITGLLLVAEPLNSYYSHYGMNDVPLVAALILAWALAPGMARTRTPWRTVWRAAAVGLTLGVACGVKYQAVFAGVFPLGAWLIMARRRRVGPLLLSLAAATLAGLAGLSLTCPLLRADPAAFVAAFRPFMAWQGSILGLEIPLAEKLPRNALAFVTEFARAGRWLLLPGIVLALRAWLRLRRQRADPSIPTALAFCALLTASVLLGRDFVRGNDLLPVIAFAILLQAGALPRRLRHTTRRPGRAVATACALLLLAVFGVISIRDSLALARPDTRMRARDWCVTHLPAGSAVWAERYVLPIPRQDIRVWGELRNLAKPEVLNGITNGVPDYLIMSSLAHARYASRSTPYYDEITWRGYGEIGRYYTPVARFEDRPLPFAHPTITVLRRAMPPQP